MTSSQSTLILLVRFIPHTDMIHKDCFNPHPVLVTRMSGRILLIKEFWGDSTKRPTFKLVQLTTLFNPIIGKTLTIMT